MIVLNISEINSMIDPERELLLHPSSRNYNSDLSLGLETEKNEYLSRKKYKLLDLPC